MKKWHFDQIKRNVKALDATYVKILQLEDQSEEEQLNDEEEQEKEKESTYKLENDETTPIGKLLMKGK
jgi:predicted amidophosphoribosyltransferase